MIDGPFQDIRLETADGGFVTGASIPVFKPMPSVVVWGMRMFEHDLNSAGKPVSVYREVFYYVIPPTGKGTP